MGKSDKSNNSNKDKKDNISGFNNQKRSSKFDDLTGTSNLRPNSPNGNSLTTKEKAKKIWKWVVIAIYLFLAGLGFTGLIQSCVLRTSSTVGAGVELYNSRNDVAPYVNTYKISEKSKEEIDYYLTEEEEIKRGDNEAAQKVKENPYLIGSPKLDNFGNIKKVKTKYYVIDQKAKENFLTNKTTIHELKDQLKTIYDIYGKEHAEKISDYYGVYDNYSSSLRILGIDNVALSNSSSSKISGSVDNKGLLQGDKNNNFIFMNNKIINYLNTNGLAYINQNDWYNINFFVLRRPTDWNSLSNSQKDFYGTGITNLSSAFIAYENINSQWIKVEQIGGQYVTKDANGDGIIDSDEYVIITDPNRIAKFRYALEAEVVSISNEDAATAGLLSSEAYARDYLQSLMNVAVRFPQINDFYQSVLGNVDSVTESNSRVIFDNLSKEKLKGIVSSNTRNNQKAIDDSKLFTLQQKNAILTYQNEVTSLMTKLGFGIRKQVYSDENSEYYEPNNNKEFKVEFLPTTKNKKDIVIGTGSAAQKPITSWKDSWRLGPFYGLIVYPLSFMINGMMNPMPSMNGWSGIIAIVIAILVTRVIVTLFTYKTLFSTHKQQQLNPKKAKIDAKYEPFKGNREMEQRKRQELAKLYKSHNISMIDPIKAMCISMPIFISIWRVVQGIPDIKSTTWLGIQFSLTSWKELFGGAWQYLPLLIIAAATQAISQLLPRILNKKRMKERANKAEIAALKKSNKTQNIVMIVFIVMSVIFEAGVQIYWIVGGLWQIMQTLAVHHIVKSNWYKTKGYKYV
ncbi:membrane protein insertase YidC [Mesomycoplasma moatsii]|uniref:membrane protein insertase YidC n=1 Tax=Mesomycoplasma moatsii TaxID=171287 RepID=UPI0003B3BC55